MSKIYSNDSITITESKNIFTIKFMYPNISLIDSLINTNIIQGATLSEDYTLIKFKANNVRTFSQYQEDQKTQTGTIKLGCQHALAMVYTLVGQLNYLISIKSTTILGYTQSNIFVINENKFIFLDTDMISEIDNKNKTVVSCPFNTTDFFVSPEILKIKTLPSYVHYKTAYFSLACLIIYALQGNLEFYDDYLKFKEIANILECLKNHPIKDTKLYYLLSRCLVEEPEKRSIILI
jgi:serine/threonine protein kinase